MAILIGDATRVLIQGIADPLGRQHARRLLAGRTRLVAGVAPGHGGSVVEGVPVFDHAADAVAATGADAALVLSRPALALDAVLEALSAGLPILVLPTAGVPVHDAIRMRAAARGRGAWLLGPNAGGVVSPGRADLAGRQAPPGRIGIVSTSSSLADAVVAELAAAGHGVSSLVCLGDDPVIGTSYADFLRLLDCDDETDAVVLIGVAGGRLEPAAFTAMRAMRKPSVAYFAGQNAPAGRRSGDDEGDAITGPTGLAACRAGCRVVGRLTEVADALGQALAHPRAARPA